MLNLILQEFYKETLFWTQLDHPNLLPFLGVNTTVFPGKLCLVAPWMVNGQIPKYLEANPSHDRLKAVSIARDVSFSLFTLPQICEIAAAIAYLHSCKIVHGDIKGASQHPILLQPS